MDGDEGQRPTAVAVCAGDTGDGAEQSGDAAPATAPADPVDVDDVIDDDSIVDDVIDDNVIDDDTTDDAATDDAVTDDATDGAAFDETPGGNDAEDDGSAASALAHGAAVDEPEPEPTAAAVVFPGSERVGARHPNVRWVALALVAVALAVSAVVWVVPSLEGSNRRFVAAVASRGLVMASGEQETLVLSAARKICDRKVAHDTLQERRSTALTSAELAAVEAVFGTETRDFTALALDAYCSS